MIGTHRALTLAATAAVALSVTAVTASGAQAAKKRTKTSATAPTTITFCVKTALSLVPASPPVFYELTENGACAVASNQANPGDFLIALADVPTPPDGDGSLTLG